MKQLKCPNCGANMNLSSYECQYCGSKFIIENDEVKIKNENEIHISQTEEIIDYKNVTLPSYDKIFDLNNNSDDNINKKIVKEIYGIAAFIIALIGLILSPFNSPSFILFISAFVLIKKQNNIKKTSLSKAAKILSIIGLISIFYFNFVDITLYN